MAMDKTVLGTAIKNALKPLNPGIEGASEAQVLQYWEIIADEIIKHIKANAEITVDNVTGITVSGVQSGGSSSGPATGTATGKVTS